MPNFLKNLSLDEFFAKVFQSFYKWRVKSHLHSELEKADLIVALSFGMREKGPGKTNVALARQVEDLVRRYKLPVVAQWEIADSSLELDEHLLHVGRTARDKKLGLITKIIHALTTEKGSSQTKNYIDSYEVLAQAAEVAHTRGLKRAIIVGHHDHAWRLAKTAEKVGFEPLFPYAQVTIYDEKSVQKYTRSRWRFMMREIPNRIYQILMGQM